MAPNVLNVSFVACSVSPKRAERLRDIQVMRKIVLDRWEGAHAHLHSAAIALNPITTIDGILSTYDDANRSEGGYLGIDWWYFDWGLTGDRSHFSLYEFYKELYKIHKEKTLYKIYK